ncbi:hypothetical protein CJ739_3476 [Mariniflexile rhizosphaerae]|uniref:hypothetical protein n=1 Tax=unclassified Mariniflexile TaxID=2643887 RepID=UPI000CACC5CE|nr:hypothetical protein [Mariniflexile sp. TRM1-10]AXP82538.1 hypothetical protein CJ739_3476 [Mariniflexile sp. TRM1-10]PLB19540.1 MAG: hypothetical protein TRG1_1589 [Flavobacteriaceae bacterium FS1-H7996/R]
MKKIILILVASMVLACQVSLAQNFSELANYEFKTPESYKTGESQVLLCANYLFSHPANAAELDRLNATKYILNWMMGTPDYTFAIGANATELTKGSDELFGLYMAALSKVVLEHTGDALPDGDIHNHAEKLLVDYCAVADNHIKPSKRIKKILKEREG